MLHRHPPGKGHALGPVLLAAALTALSLVVMAVALLTTAPSASTGEDFIPPPFDPTATVGTPQVPEALGYTSFYRDGMDFSFRICGNLLPTGTDAPVYLTNPAENRVWLKLRILDAEGTILGESGLIRPGEYLRSVSLSQKLPPNTPIRLKIMAYEPETYHSAGAVTLKTHIGSP